MVAVDLASIHHIKGKPRHDCETAKDSQLWCRRSYDSVGTVPSGTAHAVMGIEPSISDVLSSRDGGVLVRRIWGRFTRLFAFRVLCTVFFFFALAPRYSSGFRSRCVAVL